MGRILAIDYGMKRCGIAVTDPMQIIATGLDTISTPTLLQFLQGYAKNEGIEAFVIGIPMHLDGNAMDMTEKVEAFIIRLEKAFPGKKVHRIDERFTSKMASQTIAMSGMGKKKRQQKHLIDKVSATIILQSYLEQQSFL